MGLRRHQHGASLRSTIAALLTVASAVGSIPVPFNARVADILGVSEDRWPDFRTRHAFHDPRRRADWSLCLKAVRDKYMDTIGGVVPLGADVVLLGIPRERTLADAVIWFGEVLALTGLGCRLTAQCLDQDDECVASAVGMLSAQGVVLLHGGGAFAHIPAHATRPGSSYERLMEAVRGRRVVLLPQPLWYDPQPRLRAFGELLRAKGHQDTHLLVPSLAGMDYASNMQRGAYASVTLIPDSAFNIGPLNQKPTWAKIKWDVLYSRRWDHKARGGEEWDGEKLRGLLSGFSFQETNWTLASNGTFKGGEIISAEVFPPVELALQRTLDAIYEVRKGRYIVTDHPHSLILGILADVPVIALEPPESLPWGGDVSQVTEFFPSVREFCDNGLWQFQGHNLTHAALIINTLIEEKFIPKS